MGAWRSVEEAGINTHERRMCLQFTPKGGHCSVGTWEATAVAALTFLGVLILVLV